MGEIHKFSRRPTNRKPSRYQPVYRAPQRTRRLVWRSNRSIVKLAVLGLVFGGVIIAKSVGWESPASEAATFQCPSPHVIDGDTIRCGSTRVRLSGIDAPEMPGHCRPGRECTPGDPIASKENLRALLSNGPVQCERTDTDAYGRTVARCSAGGADLSCAQIAADHAVRRYALLICR